MAQAPGGEVLVYEGLLVEPKGIASGVADWARSLDMAMCIAREA